MTHNIHIQSSGTIFGPPAWVNTNQDDNIAHFLDTVRGIHFSTCALFYLAVPLHSIIFAIILALNC